MPNAETRAPRELRRIAQDLWRMYDGPAWHGPSVRESLDDVTAGMAVARAHPNAHNIHDIAHHVAAWVGETTRRLQGGAPGEPAEGNFPPSDAQLDDAAWKALLARMRSVHEELQRAILAFDVNRLDEVAGGADAGDSETTYLTMLHGVISHDAYHAGQIVLLRKSLG